MPKRMRGRELQALRARVFAYWGTTCHLCGEPIDMSLPGIHRRGPTIDHLLPHSLGGADEVGNCRPAHLSCNASRGNGTRGRRRTNPSRLW